MIGLRKYMTDILHIISGQGGQQALSLLLEQGHWGTPFWVHYFLSSELVLTLEQVLERESEMWLEWDILVSDHCIFIFVLLVVFVSLPFCSSLCSVGLFCSYGCWFESFFKCLWMVCVLCWVEICCLNETIVLLWLDLVFSLV